MQFCPLYVQCFSLRNILDAFYFVPNTVPTAGNTFICLVPQEVRTERKVRMGSDFDLLMKRGESNKIK